MSWSNFFDRLDALANTTLFTLAGTEVNAVSILTFFIIILVSFWLSRLLGGIAERWLRARGVREEGSIATTKRLLHYGVVLTGIAVAIQTIGINLGALFAAGAVVAVAIGFAMQNILQNFVSGIILLVERTIKPGDVLELEGRMVRVMTMSIRATVARTLEDEDLIIPNSNLVQAVVKNITLRDTHFRIRVPVGA